MNASYWLDFDESGRHLVEIYVLGEDVVGDVHAR